MSQFVIAFRLETRLRNPLYGTKWHMEEKLRGV